VTKGRCTERTASIGLFGVVLVCLGACAAPEDAADRLLARAYEDELRWSDLRQVIPLDATAEDSTALAQRYINNWVQQHVVLHMAESNLLDERLDLEEQMEDYRRSLLIFNYEQALVEQKLDTSFSDAEIQGYYDQHKANFELKDNIVRARWFKVNEADDRVVRKMSERFLDGSSDKMREVELWLAGLGVTIMDRSSGWAPWTGFEAEIPLGERESAAVMASNGKRVIREGGAAWFVEVLDHRDKNTISPLELVHQDIRSILLNQRKLKLIETMRANLYKQAQENNDVEIFQ